MASMITYILILFALIMFGAVFYYLYLKKKIRIQKNKVKVFPEKWRTFLEDHVEFYDNLDERSQRQFEERIKNFIAEKKIIGVDTEIDDEIKLMVAVSAIIPMFAFPKYNYPNLKEVLIYPNGFTEDFSSKQEDKGRIAGMVGNRFMNGSMILSKDNLERAFKLDNQKHNVGIHEFIHLIDNQDGAVDGIPEILIKNSFVAPWLELISEKMREIEQGKSDISKYALKSKSEFLAVSSEYFFGAPEKFEKEHPKLYEYLTEIFDQDPANE